MSRMTRRDGTMRPNKVEPRHRVAAFAVIDGTYINYQMWWRDGETQTGAKHSPAQELYSAEQIAWLDRAENIAQKIADLDPKAVPVEDKDADTVVTIGMLRVLLGRAEDLKALRAAKLDRDFELRHGKPPRRPCTPDIAPLLEALEDRYPR